MTFTSTLLNRVSWLLTAIGALNWGLKGVAQFDLVTAIFGKRSPVRQYVYGLVGLAGLWSTYHLMISLVRPALPRETRRRMERAA